MIDKQKVIELKNKDFSYNEIAKKLNISKSTVYNVIKDNRVERNDNKDVLNTNYNTYEKDAHLSIVEQANINLWYRDQLTTKTWRDALLYNEQYHNKYYLFQVFREIQLDTHVTGCVNLRKSRISGMPFFVYNNDVIDDKLHKFFDKFWFYKFIDLAMDSIFESVSLIEFLSFNNDGSIKDLQKIPLKFINSHEAIFVRNPQASMYLYNSIEMSNTIDYLNDKDFSPFLVECLKNRTDNGALCDITPLYIWKRSAQQAWATAAESFSIPIRMAKTNKINPNERKRLFDLVKNMSKSLAIVLDSSDEIEILDQNKTDVKDIYLELINLCNNEISKRLLGGTLIVDSSGSFKQGEIHQRQFDSISREDSIFIEHIINDKLIPKMKNLGLIKENIRIEFDRNEQLSALEKMNIDKILMDKYTLDVNYLNKTYNTCIITNEELEKNQNNIQTVDEIKQKTMLRNSPNGINSLILVLSNVKTGIISRESGLEILTNLFGIEQINAEKMIPNDLKIVVNQDGI